MKIEEQVLTIEQMNHLKELGLEFYETSLCWYLNFFSLEYDHVGINKRTKSDYLQEKRDNLSSPIPTLTLQEILEMLPKKIEINSREYYLFINYQDGEVSYAIAEDEMFYTNMFEDIWPNTLQGVYNMLCWVIKQGYLKQE